MITAPTGTSPTSQAFCAWSSATRIANSSDGVIAAPPSRLGALVPVDPRLQRAVGGLHEIVLDLPGLVAHRALRAGRRAARHAARDGDDAAVARAGVVRVLPVGRRRRDGANASADAAERLELRLAELAHD